MPLELNSIKADPAKLEAGCWWRVWMTPNEVLTGDPIEADKIGDDAALLIVPMGTAYQRALEDEHEAAKAAHPKRELTDDARRVATAKALSASVLRGWRGITMQGVPLEWSEEKAAELMSSKAWVWLTDFVVAASRFRAATLAKEEEAAAKN